MRNNMVEVFITKFEGLCQIPQTDMVGEENLFLQVVLWPNVCARTHTYTKQVDKGKHFKQWSQCGAHTYIPATGVPKARILRLSVAT